MKMAFKRAEYCRGCLAEISPSDAGSSFQLKQVKELFEECTSLSIPDSTEPEFSQGICSSCHTQCKNWHSFRSTCSKVDKFIQSSSFSLENSAQEDVIVMDGVKELDPSRCCRGCLSEISPTDSGYLIQWKEIRELFEECTSLSIPFPPEPQVPQAICSKCYTHCENWNTFRKICCKVDQFIISDSYPGDNSDSAQEEVMMIDDEKENLETTLNELELQVDSETDDDKQPLREVLLTVHLEEKAPKKCRPRRSTRLQREEKPEVKTASSSASTSSTKKACPSHDEAGSASGECPVCHEYVSSTYFHMLEKHLEKKCDTCPVCHDKHNQYAMKEHLLSHLNVRPYLCPGCDCSFLRRDILRRHIFSMHPKLVGHALREVRKTCRECEKNFSSDLEYKAHRFLHGDDMCQTLKEEDCAEEMEVKEEAGSRKPVNRCPLCKKTVKYLYEHLREAHVAGKQRECLICWKKFQRTVDVKKHMIVHSNELGKGQKRKPRECEICSKTFPTTTKLKLHMNVHRDKSGPKKIKKEM